MQSPHAESVTKRTVPKIYGITIESYIDFFFPIEFREIIWFPSWKIYRWRSGELIRYSLGRPFTQLWWSSNRGPHLHGVECFLIFVFKISKISGYFLTKVGMFMLPFMGTWLTDNPAEQCASLGAKRVCPLKVALFNAWFCFKKMKCSYLRRTIRVVSIHEPSVSNPRHEWKNKISSSSLEIPTTSPRRIESNRSLLFFCFS